MNLADILRSSLKFAAVRTGGPGIAEPGMQTALTGNMTHIWSARYADLDRHYPVLSPLLGRDETTRAAGFRKSGDARRYVLRHGMARAILGHYVHEEPAEIRFVQGPAGKPDLYPEANVQDIRFSLSSTGETVSLGISRKTEIGLDIVRIDPHYPFFEAGTYLFSLAERGWIAQTAPEDRIRRFFRIWSLKEALLKATGRDANLMQEADVAGIMTTPFLNGFYPVQIGKKEIRFFIHESGFGADYHCALASIPITETGAQKLMPAV
jgi:4'-phosphopantetheinyl transferase